MAVTLITGITRYQGLSGDSKPTTGVAAGSTFFETDTRLGYVYNGAAWVRDAKVDIASIAAGSTLIGKVQIRNNADDANIDPVAEATFTGRIGEVQATPTANTLLGRLKDLLTGIVLSASSAIIGKVGIDQTVPGTTNLVQVGGTLPAFAATPAVTLSGTVTPAFTQPDVTTTTAAVLASNASAKYRAFINDSDTIIYLKVAADAVLNQGIRLNPNGGSYEMFLGYNLQTGAVNGIHGGSGNKRLLVVEGT